MTWRAEAISKCGLWLKTYSHLNWALLDQAMLSGVNFLTAVLVARYLGVDEFGRFAIGWLCVLLFVGLHGAFVVSPMMSIGAKQAEDETPAYLGAVIVQQIACAAAAFVLLLAGVWLLGDLFPDWRIKALALPIAAATVAYQFQEFVRRFRFLRGAGASAFTNDALRYGGQIVALFFAFRWTEMDAANVFWIIAAMAALAGLAGLFAVKPIEIRGDVLRAVLARHWQFSKWLAASVAATWVSRNLFFGAAGALLGTAAVGGMHATYTLLGITHIMFFGLTNIIPTNAARRVHAGGVRALRPYIARVAALVAAATAAIVAVICLWPAFWLELAMGAEYTPYAWLLLIWGGFYLVTSLQLPLESGLKALETTRAIFFADLARAVFGLAAAYPLVQHFGLAGAVGGVVAVACLRTGILLVVLLRHLSRA